MATGDGRVPDIPIWARLAVPLGGFAAFVGLVVYASQPGTLCDLPCLVLDVDDRPPDGWVLDETTGCWTRPC